MTRRRKRIVRGAGRRQDGPGIAVAAIAVAALAFGCAGCGHVLPLGPAPAATAPLRSAIILQLVRSQPPGPAGGCPAGSATLSAPFTNDPEVPDACYYKLGQPVTFTSAAVSTYYQPASNQQPALYGLTFTLPYAEAVALAAITVTAFNSREAMAISTGGKTWGVPMTAGPFTNGQFEIAVQSEDQVLQLAHIVMPST